MRTGGFKGGLLLTLVIALLITPLLILSSSLVHAALTPHDPIRIYGNDDFIPANGVVAGSGTESDPYIIQNWAIDASTAPGVKIRNTTAYFVIRNCYVHDGRDSRKYGIRLHNVINGKIDNNLSENNSVGIRLWKSDNNTLLNNTCSNNSWEGIHLGYYSSNNLISNNTCSNNVWNGISIWENSDNNLISNNLVQNTQYYNGIDLYFSDNNLIFHNNFINNTNQAHDECSNYWDNGYPSGGNYWSDYTGVDVDGDEIGDTTYDIPGDNNQDRYPLMKPFGEVPSGERNWSMIAGIVAIIVIIGVVAFYVRRR